MLLEPELYLNNVKFRNNYCFDYSYIVTLELIS